MRNKNKKGKSVISKIKDIRSKNNTNWMDILRVAFKFSPNETARIISQIYKEDSKISKLSKKSWYSGCSNIIDATCFSRSDNGSLFLNLSHEFL